MVVVKLRRLLITVMRPRNAALSSGVFLILIGLGIFILSAPLLQQGSYLAAKQDFYNYVSDPCQPLREAELKDDLDGLTEMRTAMEVIQHHSYWDVTGHYRVASDVLKAEGYARYYGVGNNTSYADVTLAVQCSLPSLRDLIALTHRWQGPISITIFHVDDNVTQPLQEIVSLRHCFAVIRRFVSFHLVFPSNTSTVTDKVPAELLPCKYFHPDKGKPRLNLAETYNHFALQVPYPINLLRNVARKAIITEYVMVIDVDFVTSNGLRRHFVKFIAETVRNRIPSYPTVYVVPVFEMRRGLALPATKRTLLETIAGNKARSYHEEDCWPCQAAKQQNWLDEPWASHLHVSEEVLWQDKWEPYYISPNNVPFYDERFQQYGGDRISQICELHISGYLFAILNNAFAVHRGLKTMRELRESPSKFTEMYQNHLLLKEFIQELFQRYPTSWRKCKTWI